MVSSKRTINHTTVSLFLDTSKIKRTSLSASRCQVASVVLMETFNPSPQSKVGRHQPKSLLDLPEELVLHLASFLANIEDFHRLSCTCKTVQRRLFAVTPNTILRLAASSESNFFRPNTYPYLQLQHANSATGPSDLRKMLKRFKEHFEAVSHRTKSQNSSNG
jgi:hypothetical protein